MKIKDFGDSLPFCLYVSHLCSVLILVHTPVLQLEFEKGRVLVACKGTLRREGWRRDGCGRGFSSF